MKKLLLIILIILFSSPVLAQCESNESWNTAPVITSAYEISSGKLYLEWTGTASVYQVYMDGKSVSSVIVNNAVIPVTKGTHTIMVYPIDEIREVDTKIDVGIGSDKIKVLNLDLGIDLAMIGLDPKKLVAGTPSNPLSIDYSPNTILNAKPEQLSAITNSSDQVLLSFSDRYHADEYIVSIKCGNDINYVKYKKESPAANSLIQQNGNIITLTLDPSFLESQECMIPELDNKYSFTVQLRKHANDMLSGEKISHVIHQSKESAPYQYRPVAAWKTAPSISYASQTADGEITIQWDHEDYGLHCEYAVLKINKALGIKTGEEQIGITTENSFVISDLMNGSYSISVAPIYANEKGNNSSDVTINVQNDWVIAPILTCEELDANRVCLSWLSVEGVETYHITVYKGDNDSLLRFVDLDFSKYSEFDLQAATGTMEYVYSYDKEINPETGEKIKFEIYGIRHALDGSEQKTAISSKILTIGLAEKME